MAGQYLGRESIKIGAKAFMGYDADFIFVNDNHKVSQPLSDNIAELFLEPSNQLAISLIKGNTVNKSCENSKKCLSKNIQKVLNSDNQEFDVSFAKYLWWDMKHQVCLGDNEAKFN